MTGVRQWAASGLLVFVLAYVYYATEATLRVTVEGEHFRFEPATIRVRVTVEPDAQNRYLIMALNDGDVTVGRSDEELRGAAAPRTRWREFKSVPAGEYAAVAVVHRADRSELQARAAVTVLSRQ